MRVVPSLLALFVLYRPYERSIGQVQQLEVDANFTHVMPYVRRMRPTACDNGQDLRREQGRCQPESHVRWHCSKRGAVIFYDSAVEQREETFCCVFDHIARSWWTKRPGYMLFRMRAEAASKGVM